MPSANDREAPGVVDLAALARAAAPRQPIWSQTSDDLHLNLLVYDGGDGVAEHVNDEVDVLILGVDGAGTVTVDGVAHTVVAGAALLVPKGTRRAIRPDGRFAYLTCHRRRAGLWPRGVPRPR